MYSLLRCPKCPRSLRVVLRLLDLSNLLHSLSEILGFLIVCLNSQSSKSSRISLARSIEKIRSWWVIEEKDRSSSLATPFTFFVALKCCWSIIRKTARNLGRLVIYVQIGSGFMLLCNLLLKCPIINHTFGQVIISVLLHYYLWPVWKIDWMLPWSQIQNEKRCWDLQTVDVCLELILLQCIWNSSKYLELGGQQQQSKLVFFLYSCFSCWSLNDTFSVRAPVFRLPVATKAN